MIANLLMMVLLLSLWTSYALAYNFCIEASISSSNQVSTEYTTGSPGSSSHTFSSNNNKSSNGVIVSAYLPSGTSKNEKTNCIPVNLPSELLNASSDRSLLEEHIIMDNVNRDLEAYREYERQVLIDIYEHYRLKGNKMFHSSGNHWDVDDPAADYCSWKCVTCSTLNAVYDNVSIYPNNSSNTFTNEGIIQSSSVVTDFLCPGHRIEGDFQHFYRLPYLIRLNLSRNSISGVLPDDLFLVLPLLRRVRMDNNHLYGQLPKSLLTNELLLEEMSAMNKDIDDILTKMNVAPPQDAASFSRMLSSAFQRKQELIESIFLNPNVNSVISIDLSNNMFTGRIPENYLGQTAALELLNLSGNELVSPLPAIKAPQLKVLNLGHNRLNERMMSLDNSSTPFLEHLDLSHNKISGTLPDALDLNFLKALYLQSTNVGGVVPSWINSFQKYNFSGARMTGENLIPNVFCPKGTYAPHGRVGNWGNCAPCPTADFIGSIKCFIGDVEQEYQFGDYNSDGVVEDTERLHYILVEFGLLYNSDQVCTYPGIKCNDKHQVVHIDIKARYETQIPKEIGDFKLLHHLRLKNVNGSIPSELCKLKKMKYLDLAQNRLTGSIPLEIGNSARHLTHLDMTKNFLTGTIPESLYTILSLELLGVGDNHFQGTISEAIGKLSNLKELFIDLNSFEGTIPHSIGSLTKIEEMRLNKNYFSGFIPSSFGKLKKMVQLNVSSNKLEGTIPLELAHIAALQLLNLKNNKLTGSLDEVFTRAPSLSIFDVSYNSLEGRIPVVTMDMRLNEFIVGRNNFTGSLPMALCENYLINNKATIRWGCDGISCPIGFYSEDDTGAGRCLPCERESTTLFLGQSECKILTQKDDIASVFKTNNLKHRIVDDIHECEWEGVICDRSGDVVEISMPFSSDYFD